MRLLWDRAGERRGALADQLANAQPGGIVRADSGANHLDRKLEGAVAGQDARLDQLDGGRTVQRLAFTTRA